MSKVINSQTVLTFFWDTLYNEVSGLLPRWVQAYIFAELGHIFLLSILTVEILATVIIFAVLTYF